MRSRGSLGGPLVMVVLAGGLVVAGGGGCATILNGSTQSIAVNSNVPGATVTFNGAVIGRTPLMAQVARNSSAALIVSAPGYVPLAMTVGSSITVAFWGNILTGGLFGSSTDYSTRAMYEYAPSTFFAALQPEGAPPGGQASRVEDLRQFVLMNFESLARDIARGHGEYLDTALLLVDEAAARTGMADAARLQDALAASTSALDLGDALIRLATIDAT